MEIIVKVKGDGLPKLNRVLDEFGKETKTHRAYRMAVNAVGKSAWSKTRRKLAEQIGIGPTKINKIGQFEITRASYDKLAYSVTATGRPLSLKFFKATQYSYGVTAKPWGKTQKFEGAFLFSGGRYSRKGKTGKFLGHSGKFVADGHVFKRTTKASTPIEKMVGPSIPKEMIKGASAETFKSFDKALQVEAEKTLKKIIDGVIKSPAGRAIT